MAGGVQDCQGLFETLFILITPRPSSLSCVCPLTTWLFFFIMKSWLAFYLYSLLSFGPDVLRYVHPLHQTGAVDASDREAVWPAGLPAQLPPARAAPTPASQSRLYLSGRLPALVLRLFPGQVRVSPSAQCAGEECRERSVGAEHGVGEAERKQPAGMFALCYFSVICW